MEGKEFFELAEQLARGNSAAAMRSSVSRAYYAAFHVAHEFVFRDCRVNLPPDAACHKKLHELLESTHVPVLVEAGMILATLRHARNVADYKLTIREADAEENALYQLDQARDAIDVFERGIAVGARAHSIDEVRIKANTVFRLVLRP
jgi:uncharacterized protein (UPF0332 family)